MYDNSAIEPYKNRGLDKQFFKEKSERKPSEHPPERKIVSRIYGYTYSKSMDRPGKVANPARGQLNRETFFFPVRVRA